MSKQPIYYAQNDIRWKSNVYTSVNNIKQNIGNSGCGPTCGSMIVSTWTKEYLPPEACKDAITWGCRTASNGTSLSFFTKLAQKFGFEIKQTKDTNEVYNVLNKSDGESLVVCNIGPDYWTQNGHYILLYDAKDNYIYANDPASINRTRNTIDSFKKQSKSYVILTKKDYVPNDDPKPIVRRVLRWKDKNGKVLSPLMNGDDVKQVQESLNKNGFNVGIADGKFGEKTHNAIIALQSKNKLIIDGIVGENTWRIIEGV